MTTSGLLLITGCGNADTLQNLCYGPGVAKPWVAAIYPPAGPGATGTVESASCSGEDGPGVPGRQGDHLDSSVVPVEADLGDKDADLAAGWRCRGGSHDLRMLEPDPPVDCCGAPPG